MQTRDTKEWAWAAGLFEGEGYIGLWPYKKGDRREGLFHRQLTMGMTDEDVVRRFHGVVGCGRVRHRPTKKEEWRDMWRWECSRWEDMEAVLRELLPWLGERRTQAAQEMLANPPRSVGRPTQSICKRGHPLEGDNLYVWKGRRSCRACQQLREAKHQAKKAQE